MRKQNKAHRRIRKCKAGPNFPGQHLMHNKRTISALLELAQLNAEDTVLEIGAGKGALTFPLAEKAAQVIAVENDADFAQVLRGRAKGFSNISIIEKDFMDAYLPRKPFSVVANIPYAITTPIMEKLLYPPTNSLERALLVMEKGAALRFTATPITNPRILTWRMWFDLHLVKEISRNDFSPSPKVDSAAIRIYRRNKPFIAKQHFARFRALATYGLKYPYRPTVQALKGIFTPTQLKHLLKELRTERHTPICYLTEREWGVVFQTMLHYVPSFRWPR